MANRTHRRLEGHPKTDVVILTAKVVGAGAANLTLPDASDYGGGEIASATRTGTGTHSLVFRHAYPDAEKLSVTFGIIGSTAGLQARFTAWDSAAKTATMQIEVGATGTDAASGDTITITMYVRNSGRN